MKFSVIEEAFDFVSLSPDYENSAFVSRSTGQVYCTSESIELEDDEELPEEISENPDFVPVPHKNDLGLEQKLVWEFVSQELPGEKETIRSLFSRSNAQARFEEHLEGVGLLERWFEFETRRTREALLSWCKDERLRIEDAKAVTRAIQGAR